MDQGSITRRRWLVVLCCVAAFAAAPVNSTAQQRTGKVHRIGFLVSESPFGQASRIEALRQGLRELGYVEGKNIAIDLRAADGNYVRLPELARELVGLKVEVLVAFGSKAVLAAKSVSTTIPMVVPSISDPIGLGLAKSLARPGSNITGGSSFGGDDLYPKRLELLKETIPSVINVAFLYNPADPPRSKLHVEGMRAAAKALKVELLPIEIRSQKEIASVFAQIGKKGIDAIVLQQDTLFMANHKAIAELATKQRIPAAGNREFGEFGALIGYGASDAELYRRGAYFVDRILKGANPGDLPFEQAMRIELVVNLRTARALGLTIPPAILARADKVIE